VQPTAAGLYARTVDLWSQPDFYTLTAQEAHDLLPLDDAIPAVPGTMRQLVGDFPTEDECARAFAQPTVRGLLEQTCAAEVQLYALEAARNPAFDMAIDAQRRAFEADERDLMRELDRVSSWHNWALTHRLYAEWSR
jgi:hypothetical protein